MIHGHLEIILDLSKSKCQFKLFVYLLLFLPLIKFWFAYKLGHFWHFFIKDVQVPVYIGPLCIISASRGLKTYSNIFFFASQSFNKLGNPPWCTVFVYTCYVMLQSLIISTLKLLNHNPVEIQINIDLKLWRLLNLCNEIRTYVYMLEMHL